MKLLSIILIALLLSFNSKGNLNDSKYFENNATNFFESYQHFKRYIGSVLIDLGNNIIDEKSNNKLELKNLETKPSIDIIFDENKFEFLKTDKVLITDIILQSEKEVRALLPTLPNKIKLTVRIIDREINFVGGITVRADKHTPGEISVEISNVFPGDINATVKTSLAATIFHELHHIYRVWTIKENKFPLGTPNAMVNEGLAVVFAEIKTKQIFEGNSYPKEVNSWVKEILLRPTDANYSHKVSGENSDGRVAIGYRSGNYLVRKAMANSGKNILELSKFLPKEILVLAGYK
jgi:uncharacterized protein YjaZ